MIMVPANLYNTHKVVIYFKSFKYIPYHKITSTVFFLSPLKFGPKTGAVRVLWCHPASVNFQE